MLNVKLLHPDAKTPICAHPGSDLGYDIFALEDVVLWPNKVTKVRTGIAVQMQKEPWIRRYGFLVRDRSSMAAKNIFVTGGVIDAGYTGEIIVCMTFMSSGKQFLSFPKHLEAGGKIAQLIPTQVLTYHDVKIVDDLETTERSDGGFGSTNL